MTQKNVVNPKHLLHSKWTAQQVVKKQKHFIVVELIVDDDNVVQACDIEAVINQQRQRIDWRLLKDKTVWLPGWK
ncbi:TIGR02450 family Trp-rich protein [Thalassotalea agarivorans]|uniref:TIGR02450 family Trp-rich protein n=1 Tax=Thalassotalea agarivorans TaxID=349064 RepID=A0A1I0CE68_THASX|nr:TIGR02450 family Trp-rich protein [Thalassotalea agarivorans]SET17399.1 tryptophan-rich conserved hypothetical protein [Thalassotalea agarivorans]